MGVSSQQPSGAVVRREHVTFNHGVEGSNPSATNISASYRMVEMLFDLIATGAGD